MTHIMLATCQHYINLFDPQNDSMKQVLAYVHFAQEGRRSNLSKSIYIRYGRQRENRMVWLTIML